MSVWMGLLLGVVGVLVLLIVVPQVRMAVHAARLKGKSAPTTHKPSAARIRSGKKTVLYFFTPPCGACKMQSPIVDKVKKRFPDAVYKIDASRNQDTAAAYGVMGVPFFAYIAEGKLASEKAGLQQESVITSFLTE